MVRVYLVLLMFCGFFTANAQRLQAYRTFTGAEFELDSVAISARQVQRLVYFNSESYVEMRKARIYHSVGGANAVLGLLIMAYGLTSNYTDQVRWGVFTAGALGFATVVPLTRAFRKHAQEAVDLYNVDNPTSRLKTNLIVSPNGVGVQIKF